MLQISELVKPSAAEEGRKRFQKLQMRIKELEDLDKDYPNRDDIRERLYQMRGQLDQLEKLDKLEGRVLNLHESFKATGQNEDGTPKMAIGWLYGRTTVNFALNGDGHASFENGYYLDNSNSIEPGRPLGPHVTLDYPDGIFSVPKSMHSWEVLHADTVLPMITKTKQDDAFTKVFEILSKNAAYKYHLNLQASVKDKILVAFEPVVWNKVEIGLKHPDPLILRQVDAEVGWRDAGKYAELISAFDMTETEVKFMRQLALPEEIQ